MVIKSMSRKSMSFMQLIDYISREGTAEGPPVFHNFTADPDDPLRLNRAFIRNARLCPPRKNGVMLYHEILSLSPDDREQATPEILADLAEHYLALRAPEAIAWGRVHFDRNPHVHLIISGNLKNRTKKLRLSKSDFGRVKRELESYQKEHYPELAKSVVYGKSGPERDRAEARAREVKGKRDPVLSSRTPSEQARETRLREQGRGVESKKEVLRGLVLDALTAAVSPGEFGDRLGRQGITVYERNGRPAGIVSGNKKYRFTTLNLDDRLPDLRDPLGADLASEAITPEHFCGKGAVLFPRVRIRP